MKRYQIVLAALTILAFGWSATIVNAQESTPRRVAQIVILEENLADVDLEMQNIERIRKSTEERLVEAKSLLAQLMDKRAELLKQQNALGVSAASYDEIMRLLQTQKVQLTIELAGIEARREAMIEQDKSSGNSQRAVDQAVLGPLQELAAIQAERLKQVEQLREAGGAPHAEVLNAKERLLEIQIRLAEVTQGGKANVQAPADRELLSVSLARAEAVARLNKVNQLLEEYVHARAPIDSLSRVTSEINATDLELGALPNAMRQYDEQLKSTMIRRDQLIEQLERAKREAGDQQEK